MASRKPFFTTDPALTPILDELRPLEPIFHTPDFGLEPADFERRTAPDYWEVGASGRRYSRDFILQTLADNPPANAATVRWRTTGHALRQLGPETFLLTYTLRQEARLTRRSALWQRTPTGWQILYHQGTLVSANEDDVAPQPIPEKRTRPLKDKGMSTHLLKAFTCFAVLLCTSITSYAQQTQAPPTDNAQMLAIVVADQKDRGNNYFYEPGTPEPRALSGIEIRKNDDAREDTVRALLKAGSLHTASDYFRAALVFQHAYKPDDILLAHVLATVAVSKGSADALWLSAATLDRYLVDAGKQQIFGTQFSPKPQQPNGSAWQQSPVSPLLSDALRSEMCVVPISQQSKGLPAHPSTTSLSPCPAAAIMKQ